MRMSLDGRPKEFLGESDDDPLIPLEGEPTLREGIDFLQEARRTGKVDVQLLLGMILDLESRAELAMRYNVTLIRGLDDELADLFGNLLEEARAMAEECGASFDEIEGLKREYAARLEGELQRRLRA